MLKDRSKLEAAGKYGGARVYIPSGMVNDSQFPFKVGEEVEVEINPISKTATIRRPVGKEKR